MTMKDFTHTPIVRIKALAGLVATGAVVTLLTGCSGGSSGNGSGDGETPLQTLNQALADPLVAGNAAAKIASAAQAGSNFGSITQSSNVDGNTGVTLDRVTVMAEHGANGPSFAIQNGTEWSIELGEGNPRPIADAADVIEWQGASLSKRLADGTLYVEAYTDIEAPTEVTTGGTYSFTFPTINVGGSFVNTNSDINFPAVFNGASGQASCTGCSFVYTTGQLQVTAGSLIFTPDNGAPTTLTPGSVVSTTPDTDYLAGGVWLYIPDDASSAEDYVVGVFGDGSDPFDQNNLAAVLGTATYRGDAAGLYSEQEAGETFIGEFDGDVTLNADFSDDSDLGTIGGFADNFHVDDEPMNGRLMFEEADIGATNSGGFTGTVSGSVDEHSYTGNWGGQFYGNGDAQPGSVAGTFGGQSDDSTISFVGVYGAHKEDTGQ